MKAVKFVLMLPVYFIGILTLYFIFTVLNRAYWDAEVRRLCETKGGATVYETVDLSVPEYANISISISGIPFIPSESLKSPDDPLFSVTSTDIQQEFGGVEIYKSVYGIVRSADGKLLSESVSYGRRGGDFATLGSPGSSFSCSQMTDHQSSLEIQTFNLQGEI